ncbi:MAG: type II toxin-antitoxin system VapC family toxin [Actinobacteria bacterium]|nr:type II toxin-antitoxin system VapC family toxin [Actinomycetota bacterium]
MRVVADTGPLVAAANRRDRAHRLASALVTELGRDLIVPTPVAVEVDQLLRARLGREPAREFLAALATGEHSVAYLTAGLLRAALEFDRRFGDLDLGLVDASVMAIADRHDLPILTFDFEDFRAASPARGYWRLVVDEARYQDAVRT